MSTERLKRMIHWLPSLSENEIEQLLGAIREWLDVIDAEKLERQKRRNEST